MCDRPASDRRRSAGSPRCPRPLPFARGPGPSCRQRDQMEATDVANATRSSQGLACAERHHVSIVRRVQGPRQSARPFDQFSERRRACPANRGAAKDPRAGLRRRAPISVPGSSSSSQPPGRAARVLRCRRLALQASDRAQFALTELTRSRESRTMPVQRSGSRLLVAAPLRHRPLGFSAPTRDGRPCVRPGRPARSFGGRGSPALARRVAACPPSPQRSSRRPRARLANRPRSVDRQPISSCRGASAARPLLHRPP